MRFKYSDGGREAAGRKGSTGDCVCRAICNATGRPYAEVYNALAKGNQTERRTKRSQSDSYANRRSASGGINVKRKWFRDYMYSLGFRWTPTMKIGQGCKVHLREDELPKGNLVVSTSRHYTCVKDGVLFDTYDCTRDGARCVYGYWSL